MKNQVVIAHQIHRALVAQRNASDPVVSGFAGTSAATAPCTLPPRAKARRDRSSQWSGSFGRASRSGDRRSAPSSPGGRFDEEGCDARDENRDFADRLAFELKLDDRHRLLHLPHGELIAYPLAVARKAGRWIVRPHRPHQLFQRRHRDPVAHLELEEPLVTQRNPQNRGDTGLLAKGGAHPGNVMISPGNRDVGLTHDVINCFVDARTAVAEIAQRRSVRKKAGCG